MSILTTLLNPIDSIGAVFGDFFAWLNYGIFLPIMSIFLFVLFLAINYYLIKLHIWLFAKGFNGFIKIADFLKQKEDTILEKFVR